MPQNPLLNPQLSVPAFDAILSEMLANSNADLHWETMASLTEVLDCYLQGQWTPQTQPEKQTLILAALKSLLGAPGQGNIVLAQIDSPPGQILQNGRKIMAYMRAAEAIGADAIIFPELSLMGYPIYDGIGRYHTLVEQNIQVLEALAKRAGKTRAIVGFIEPRQDNESQPLIGRSFFNALAVLGESRIEHVIRKSLLPNYGEFDDYRMFEPAPTSAGSIEIEGTSYGFVICEDGWNDADFFAQKLYHRDPVLEQVTHGAEIIVNCSASPTRALKEQLKHAMLSSVAQKYQRPMVYVNRCGAVDEVIFDGTSRFYNAQGQLIARAKPFAEQFLVVNPKASAGKIYALPQGEAKTMGVPKAYDPHDTRDLDRTYRAIITGIQSYFQNTQGKKAVLGLSGGLDSAVTAVLLADALGSKNVLGVSMPSSISSEGSRTDAQELAQNLGIGFLEIPIAPAVETFTKQYKDATGDQLPAFLGEPLMDDIASQNIQAMIRATYLRFLANQYNGMRPIATSDKSELYVGYATVNGDMSGALAPIGDVTKMKLFALARWMNTERAKAGLKGIPEAILRKKPGAELAIDPKTHQLRLAEDDYGPYEFRDEIIWRLEHWGQSMDDMLTSPFWYEKHVKPLSVEAKRALLQQFFTRMGASFFKWYLMPTTLNIDAKSITKSSFRIPITAGGSCWQGLDAQEIDHALDGG